MKLHSMLKHLFIPHDKNDYRPHFFRELSIAIILFVSIFLLGASYGSSFFLHKTVLGVSVAADVLIDLTNETRLAYNEAPLTRSLKLSEAAQMKGEDMARLGYFAHNSPAGITPWYWFNQAGYKFLYAGENLAINYTESVDIENAWMASPLHRENLLNVKFHEIGIAAVEGVYENNPTIFVVQMFGTPARVMAASSAPSNKNTSTTTSSVQKELVATTTEKIVNVNEYSASTTEKLEFEDGLVKGEATGTLAVLSPLVTTKELVIVKNNTTLESEASETLLVGKYSTWYERLLFGGPRYVDLAYKGLIVLVAFALVLMVLIEIRKQHYKHILYGVILLIVLTVLVGINRGFF